MDQPDNTKGFGKTLKFPTPLPKREVKKYYFHLAGNAGEVIDETGIHVESLEVAHQRAREAIDELLDDDDGTQDNWIGWQLQIADEWGRVLVTMNLSEPHKIEPLALISRLSA